MDEQAIVGTRQALHAVGESILAGPQYRARGTIRLRVLPGGFGQVAGPLRVEGTDLVGEEFRVPLRGTLATLGAAAGVQPDRLEDVYHEHAVPGPEDELTVDPAAARLLHDWFATGEQALHTLDPEREVVLWPEHFDLGVTLEEVNYGVSPGDSAHPLPYAYVGPWTAREGAFWNAAFGAVRQASELPDAEALAAFLAQGRAEAAASRPA